MNVYKTNTKIPKIKVENAGNTLSFGTYIFRNVRAILYTNISLKVQKNKRANTTTATAIMVIMVPFFTIIPSLFWIGIYFISVRMKFQTPAKLNKRKPPITARYKSWVVCVNPS